MSLVRVMTVVAMLAAVWLPPAEASESRFRELGRLPSFPVTDASRYVAWTDQSSYVEVVDTAEHTTIRVALPPDCEFLTVGVGYVVLLCETGTATPDGCPLVKPVFYNLATSESHTPPDIDGFYSQQGSGAGGGSTCKYFPDAQLGSRWLRYAVGEFPYWQEWYLDWHQGGDPARTTESADSVIDLAEADRLRRLCSPVRRKRDSRYDPDDPEISPPSPYLPLEWVGRRTVTRSNQFALFLQRCGSAQVRRVARGVGSWGLGRRAVYWSKGEKIHFFILRTKRRVAYSLPLRYEHRQVIATDTRLYVTDSDGWDPSIRTTFVTKIPRR
jgi:hypothetical protein